MNGGVWDQSNEKWTRMKEQELTTRVDIELELEHEQQQPHLISNDFTFSTRPCLFFSFHR